MVQKKRMPARPRHLRREGFVTLTDQRKMLIMDLLRRNVAPMTKLEICAALGWPESILVKNNSNIQVTPLNLLIDEGLIGVIPGGRYRRYYADPDISKMIPLPPNR